MTPTRRRGTLSSGMPLEDGSWETAAGRPVPAKAEDWELQRKFPVQTPPVLSGQNRVSKALVEPKASATRPPGTVLIFQESWAARVRKIPAVLLLQTVFRLHPSVLPRVSAFLREKWFSVFPARC